MKRTKYLFFVITVLSFAVACKNVNFRKTKTGLVYKIFPGNGKDSLIKQGNVVKFNYTIRYNDSMMDRFNSYDKMPGFVQIRPQDKPSYDFVEILTKMRKGDSAVTVQMSDTIFKSYRSLMQILPRHAKKGDRLTMTIKITEVFRVDSIAQADFDRESERDRPRLMKEQEEQMAKMQKEQEERQLKQDQELEKSGEMGRQMKEVQDYLARKRVNAQKTGKGTYVYIQQQGTGPAATDGKHLKVKYSGRLLRNDSTFESNIYPSLHLGRDAVIRGWTEGLQLFKQGGKGTLYIPAFLAYGFDPGPGGKPAEALVFDIEILEVSDNPIPPPPPTQEQQPNPAR